MNLAQVLSGKQSDEGFRSSLKAAFTVVPDVRLRLELALRDPLGELRLGLLETVDVILSSCVNSRSATDSERAQKAVPPRTRMMKPCMEPRIGIRFW